MRAAIVLLSETPLGWPIKLRVGSVLLGTGYKFARAAPTRLILFSGITFPGNGIFVSGSTMVTGAVLKSPARSLRVGTSVVLVTACRRRAPSYENIQKSLSLPS